MELLNPTFGMIHFSQLDQYGALKRVLVLYRAGLSRAQIDENFISPLFSTGLKIHMLQPVVGCATSKTVKKINPGLQGLYEIGKRLNTFARRGLKFFKIFKP